MRFRHRTIDIRLVVVVASAVVATLVLVALALRPASPPQVADRGGAPEEKVGPGRDGDGGGRYVALGDWWAAGPGPAAPNADEEARSCQRAETSYPTVVAARLGLQLVHRGCAGASPEVVGLGGRAPDGREVLPQIQSLSDRTDLVTLSVGAESADLVARTVSACLRVASRTPSGSPCEDSFGEAGLAAIATGVRAMGQRTESLLREVARRAPRAQVVVVGYVDFFATDTGCFSRTDVADGDLAYLSEALQEVVDAVRDAVERSGATYVDPAPVFAGHLVCAQDPYVTRDSRPGGPGFSLTTAGHRAVAGAVVRALDPAVGR